MTIDPYGYSGKRVAVLGAASGIGAAAVKLLDELGAEVVALDIAPMDHPVAQSVAVDLRDRASVDAAVEQLHGTFDAAFSCAGVADGAPGLMAINFIGQRHFIERLIARGRLVRGALVAIASLAGLPWQRKLNLVLDFLAASGWDNALAWVDEHPGTDNYMFSKQAMCGYVASQAFPLLKQGIRINSVMPGPTDTPLARANADIWLGFGKDYRDAAGVGPLQADQVAGAMAFLGSEAASGICGLNLLVDQGYAGSGITDAFPAPLIKLMLGMD